MEIRFKSSECDAGELVKNFKQNFENKILEEIEYSKFNDGVVGTVKEIHLDQAYVVYQDYHNINIQDDDTLEVTHDHNVFLLQFVIDGELACCLDGEANSSFTLRKNTYNLFYIPASNNLYKYSSKKKQVLNIYFLESYLQSKMGYCFTQTLVEFQKAKKRKRPFAFFDEGLLLSIHLKNIIQDFLECSFEGTTKQSFLEAKLTELVLVSLMNNESEKEVSEISGVEKENLRRVEDYIQTHLKEELNISELSLIAGLNTSKLKKSFKKVYGTTIFKYITFLRIEKAKELILKEKYTISEASYEVGYKNPQHFTVAFKKKLGYLPSQLKK
ncbi:AraC family transcriptional regulator [Wenyingzhuangia sp. chi5]|uniref:AraC family transcriptional regulator n=1 Tax=Wenyingzhuangia gilva TaxID=3057677 RepID=A0ABT8VQD6_9FLAO|nr:AraC family transcriptional regulator [Wenyingzhuangia sp. chi5]MDO3694190.1 AraC family transcriptional regulator [Wenyingzhuangia sp. chi5]